MTPRERLFALEHFGIKLGLDNITTIVNALGRPDRRYPIVHVAGTNGKGSVTAMVERGLRALGYRTGRYTSPHLHTIEERVAIDGAAVDGATFDAVAAAVMARVDALIGSGELPQMPTFFEVTTAIAFEIFQRAGVTAAVIEVGLGGRYDATNVVAPAVTAITTIDFDHERHLGSTLEQIAFEKAGIIKPLTPVVVGAMPAVARSVIEQAARARQAPLIDARAAAAGTAVRLALSGAHQVANAAVAVASLRTFAAADPRLGAALVAAITDVDWPARLEWLRLRSGCELLIDAAHNPAGARSLASFVLETGEPLPLVLGLMRDKNCEEIVRALAPAVSRFAAVSVESTRALPARELAQRIRQQLPTVRCDVFDDLDAAVRDVCREGRAMAAGSIFLVGPLRARLLSEGAAPVRYPSKASLFFLE